VPMPHSWTREGSRPVSLESDRRIMGQPPELDKAVEFHEHRSGLERIRTLDLRTTVPVQPNFTSHLQAVRG